MNNKMDGLNVNMIIFDEFKKLNKQGENKMKNKNVTFNNRLEGITVGNGYMTLGNMPDKFAIEDVIFNPPYTIINWSDKTKTIVRQGINDEYDEEKGFVWAVAKKALTSNGKINKYIEEANRPQEKPLKKKKLPKPQNTNPDDDIPF